VGDEFVQQGKVEWIGKVVEHIRKNGLVAGVAGHSVEVPVACEKAGLRPDFYMKTFNRKRYWSAGPTPRLDSVWEETPERTRAFMQEVDRPWIAYKVLGASATAPGAPDAGGQAGKRQTSGSQAGGACSAHIHDGGGQARFARFQVENYPDQGITPGHAIPKSRCHCVRRLSSRRGASGFAGVAAGEGVR